MVNGIKTSAAAMMAQGERLAVLTNNLANASATGFKADAVGFFQPLTSPRAAGSVSPTDPAAPLTPPSFRTRIDLTAGAMQDTGNALDLALDGEGFFVLGDPEGLRLTRAGSFTRTRAGLLAAPDGAPVLDTGQQPIRLPERGAIVVDDAGAVSVDGRPVARLLIASAPADRLVRQGGVRFALPEGVAPTPLAGARVRQGVLEASNVNPVLTLVEMIDALRVYEAAQRATHGIDETLRRAVNDVGRP